VKKRMAILLLASVGLAYTVKTIVELSNGFSDDIFDLSEDEEDL
jgi:hypothetical protein